MVPFQYNVNRVEFIKYQNRNVMFIVQIIYVKLQIHSFSDRHRSIFLPQMFNKTVWSERYRSNSEDLFRDMNGFTYTSA